MRISRERKNRRCFFRGAFSLLLFALLFSFPVHAEEPFSIQVTYGYRNTAKNGQMLPVSLDFENNTGETLDGYAVIEIPGDDSTLSYTYPLSVPAGQSRKKCTVTIPDEHSAESGDSLNIRIIDDYGEEIQRKTVKVVYHGNGQDVLCGILSGEVPDLQYFGNVSIGGSLSTKTVTLFPADIPEEHEGLSQLDLIVISSFDMESLSEEAADSVFEWVQDGGTLLIGTGRQKNALGIFSRKLPGLRVSGAKDERIDMGMQYSTKGPDGAVIELPVCRVEWDGAEAFHENGETALTYKKSFGYGSVSVASCDLCGIRDFCLEHPDFTEDFVKELLGSSGIERIGARSSSSRERYESARNLTNTYTEKRIPGLLVYVLLAIIYLLITGLEIFELLKAKGLALYYPLSVVMLSAFFVLILWIISSRTRITRPSIDYAAICRFEGDFSEREIRGYLRIASPEKKALTLELSGDTAVRPVSVSGDISVASGKSRMIALTGQRPFEENIFAVDETEPVPDPSRIVDAAVYKSGTSFAGSIANTSGVDYTDAFLLSRGQIIPLGDIRSGESVEISPESVLYGPVTDGKAVAGIIGGAGQSTMDAALIGECLKEDSGSAWNGLTFIAFAKGYVPGFLSASGYDLSGSVLYSVKLPVMELPGEMFYRNSLLSGAGETSGSYDIRENTVSGNATSVVTYSLGNGTSIRELKLVPLSEEFLSEDLCAFKGQISVYNYENGSYDLLGDASGVIRGAALSACLSPSNTVTLRYVPDDAGTDGPERMYLPVPFALCEQNAGISGGNDSPRL